MGAVVKAHNVEAERYRYQQARDLVVSVSGTLYVQALAALARADAAKVQRQRAEAIYRQAADLKQSGLVAGIDVLRAEVELSAETQRAAAESDLEKVKLQLARVTQIASRVGGTIVRVPVSDNQQVEPGTVLVELDPRDYQVALDKARAELADAEAASAAAASVPITSTQVTGHVTTARSGLAQAQGGIAAAEREIDVSRARLATAQARVREAEANGAKAARDVERLRGLLAKDEVSQQQCDTTVVTAEAQKAEAARAQAAEAEAGIRVAESRLAQAQAGEQQARAELQTAQTGPQQVAAASARAQAAQAHVEQAKASLAQADLNLQYLRAESRSVDYWGLGMLTVGIGALQIVLDKGQEADWFSSTTITALAIVSAVTLVALVIHERTTDDPVVDLRIFAARSYAVGVFLMTVVGFVLYGSTVLLPIMLQTLLGYPPMQAGIAMAPRGIGSFFMMPLTGLMTGRFDARKLLTSGLLIGGGTLLWLSRLNLQAGYWDIFWPQLMQRPRGRAGAAAAH